MGHMTYFLHLKDQSSKVFESLIPRVREEKWSLKIVLLAMRIFFLKKYLWKNEASANKQCCQSSTFEVFWKKSFCNSFHGSDHCLCSLARCTHIFNMPKSPRNESTRLQHNSLLWELNVDLRKIYRKLNWWRNHNKFKITSILDILNIISGNGIHE